MRPFRLGPAALIVLSLGWSLVPDGGDVRFSDLRDADLDEGLETVFAQGRLVRISPIDDYDLSHAISRLQPGDTLILGDGDYRTLGQLEIHCSQASPTCEGRPCANGTGDRPITVRAENEGKATLHWGGSIEGCAHWRVSGLTLAERGLRIAESQAIQIQRIHALGPERGPAAIDVERSRDVRIEDSSVERFGRFGIRVANSQRVELLRNEVRDGDTGFEVVETPGGNGSEVSLLGNAAFSVGTGVMIADRSGAQGNVTVRDQLVARARDTGIAAIWGGVHELVLRGCTVLGDSVARPNWAYFVLNGAPDGRGSPPKDATFRMVNSIALGARAAMNYDYGTHSTVATGYRDCRISDSIFAGNTLSNAAPPDCQAQVSTTDPNEGVPQGAQLGLGPGQVADRIPAGNFRLSLAGADGEDIGANLRPLGDPLGDSVTFGSNTASK